MHAGFFLDYSLNVIEYNTPPTFRNVHKSFGNAELKKIHNVVTHKTTKPIDTENEAALITTKLMDGTVSGELIISKLH